jgi:methylated-DNA-[protein]-cysteine S-methyltransferase
MTMTQPLRKSYYHWPSPVGKLTLVDQGHGLSHIKFGFAEIIKADSNIDVFKKAILQLEEYFSGKRKHFDIQLDLTATPFQHSVYQALQAIPWGQTQSYGDIAHIINNPKAYRAVGLANNKNPIPIIIPCHRVIGKNSGKHKRLTGYAGGLDLKKLLLDIEGCEYD